jgi:pre-rRNA-processing protein RIX1
MILEILDQQRPQHIKHVLKSLYSSPETITTAAKSELNHLVSKTTNLLNSRDDYKRWFGCHIVQVLGMNPLVLTNGGSNFITALLKLINDQSIVSVNFQNACRALDTIMSGIRGKPVLTREILTPNLPHILCALLDNLERDFKIVLPILTTLLTKNTTTFKPFLKKFEAKLIKLLVENFCEMDSELQALVCKSYAYLHLIKPNQTTMGAQPLPDDQWRLKILQLLDELRSVVLIYDNMIDLKSERDSMDLIKQLPEMEKKEYIFPFLSIDLSDALSIVTISERIEVLVRLVIAFITSSTPFPIRVPLGLIIQCCNLLMGLSLNYIQLKPELKRSTSLKRVIQTDLSKTQALGCLLLHEVAKTYKKLILPHLQHVLSSLEVMIPMELKKLNKVDKKQCLNQESEMLGVISSATEILKLFQGLTQLELINKLVDVSLTLLEKRTPLEGVLEKQPIANNAPTGQKKNKKKNKDSTPMSDLLSHSELFEVNPPKSTIHTILPFFEIVLKKVTNLVPTFRIKLLKYIISTSVKEHVINGSVGEPFKRILEIVVLYPNDGETYSILPIAKRLLPNNEKLSLLTNPRFPVLDVKYRPKTFVEDEEEDEGEEMDVDVKEFFGKETGKDSFVEELKKVEIRETPAVSVFKSDEEMKTLSFPESKPKPIETAEKEDKTRPLEENDDTPSKRIKIQESGEEPVNVPVEVDDEDDSDFEIPEIDVDSD